MSQFDEKMAIYEAQLQELNISYDVEQLKAAAKGLGPSIYNVDSSKVSCSDDDEKARVKANFLMKKLGMADSPVPPRQTPHCYMCCAMTLASTAPNSAAVLPSAAPVQCCSMARRFALVSIRPRLPRRAKSPRWRAWARQRNSMCCNKRL